MHPEAPASTSPREVVRALPALIEPGEAWTGAGRTFLGMAVDTAMVRGMQLLVDAFLMPRPADLPRLRASATPYLSPELRRDPRRFFAFLDTPPCPVMTERSRRERAGGMVIAREFAKRYRPYASSEHDRSPPIAVEHWVHDERPAGTVVALNGFAMSNPRLGAPAMLLSDWFDRGLDVALLSLPFRRLFGPRWPGVPNCLFPSVDVGDVNEAIREAVHDVWLVTTWLRAATPAPVGLLGLSLGGYVAALMAALTDELDFVIPMNSPASIGDLAWRFFARSRHYRSPTHPPPSREELQELYRVHSPLSHSLRLPRERVLIVAGRGDRVVPPEHPLALWHHWGGPEIHWFGGSHLVPFGRDHLVATVVQHLSGLGIPC